MLKKLFLVAAAASTLAGCDSCSGKKTPTASTEPAAPVSSEASPAPVATPDMAAPAPDAAPAPAPEAAALQETAPTEATAPATGEVGTEGAATTAAAAPAAEPAAAAPAAEPAAAPAAAPAPAKTYKFESTDIKVGAGDTATDGKTITIHYVGTFDNGAKFDSSIDRESPLSFVLGKGEQIKGWDQGIKGMKVGGKRKLVIPPELGYGKNGVKGVIPPDSTLFFEVELLSVK